MDGEAIMEDKSKKKKKVKSENEPVKLSIKEKRLAHRRQIEDLMEKKLFKKYNEDFDYYDA